MRPQKEKANESKKERFTDVNKAEKNSTSKSDSRNASARNEKCEPKCFKCNHYGHFARDYPEHSEENAAKSTRDKYSAYSTKSTERGETKKIESNPSCSLNKYLKEVKINSVTLKSFIDPGSSECTIKASIALLNDLAIEKNRINLRSFGPSEYTVMSPGFVTTFVDIDRVVADHVQLRVVPDDCQHTDVITVNHKFEG